MTRSTPPPEAEFQARIDAALVAAFPLLNPQTIRRETRFTLRLGHKTHEEDALAVWTAGGRADMILYDGDRALAVLELKRADQVLDQNDRDQGLSYAQHMTPRPPLVVITNGTDLEIYDGATGERIQPTDLDATRVADLFSNAAKLATGDRTRVVETLLGPNKTIWLTAVRSATAMLIGKLTGPGPGQPFSADALFRREVTTELLEALETGQRLVMVESAPSGGKSSVLRDLAERTAADALWGVLMIRNDGGPGLFRRLANELTQALGWPVSEDAARTWLQTMKGTAARPALIIAIDDLAPGSAMASDVLELAETGLGDGLRLVVTTDDGDALVHGRRGRGLTAIGSVAIRLKVDLLSDSEFDRALSDLKSQRIVLTPGAHKSGEYRAPWVLRRLVDAVVESPRHRDAALVAHLPATLGAHLIDEAREHAAGLDEMLHGYRRLASAHFNDDRPLPSKLALEMARAFVVRRDVADTALDLGDLAAGGWVRRFRHPSGVDLVAPTAPEVYVSELAQVVADELAERCGTDAVAAADWLMARMERYFLGDLIGAQAIRDLATQSSTIPFDLIAALRARQPSSTPMSGLALLQFEGRMTYVEITPEGRLTLLDEEKRPIGRTLDVVDDRPHLHENTIGWQILAQLALFPSVLAADRQTRADLMLLEEIGKCPFPLLGQHALLGGHLEHAFGIIQVACEDDGIIEPITAAMQNAIQRDGTALDAWIDHVLSSDSLALVYRLYVAFRHANGVAGPTGAWIEATLEGRIRPKLLRLLPRDVAPAYRKGAGGHGCKAKAAKHDALPFDRSAALSSTALERII